MLTIKDVLKIFQQYGISTSEQVIRRWCRTGILKAELTSKKEGYEIHDTSVYQLLEKKLRSKESKNSAYLRGFEQGYSLAQHLPLHESEEKGMNQGLREAIDNYYRGLADREEYVDPDKLMGKYSKYVFNALREYNPTKYCELGMTEELGNWIEAKNAYMTNEETERMHQIEFDQSGNILDVAKRRYSKMLEIEEILKDEFVQSLKIEEPVPSIDELF
ncbi:hypothetical protein [Enterococcus faecalis]|uniref:hypothetical protein n=1 Tax=Enterococcus faecalis TaxID=1351 RepID=UPI001D17582F|nr:hypothetical protein [Enterococcus faecalis]MCC4085297.1 hypothetical protein [Enterococcus faecalis]